MLFESCTLSSPVGTTYELQVFAERLGALLGRATRAGVDDDAIGRIWVSVDGPPWYTYAARDLLRDVTSYALEIEARFDVGGNRLKSAGGGEGA